MGFNLKCIKKLLRSISNFNKSEKKQKIIKINNSLINNIKNPKIHLILQVYRQKMQKIKSFKDLVMSEIEKIGQNIF